ncbi:Pentatricopeptide repeat (PPR) superfamily protein [Rhynchospora pubera]|uniref:Pentatricopeptide repeat (PPR) superfamily protein n=1 Tax=Rhynchospora pubera TaxID=906938 RepID=A0AAV8GTL1_9POAL|nr:Pentatricopeptide repeat (PPR) superfamily protein [Rhynchospora pubera]
MALLKNLIPHHSALSLIDNSTSLRQALQIHAHLLTSGAFTHDPSSFNSFLSSLALSSSPPLLSYSHSLLFTSPPQPPSFITVNSLIRAHSSGPSPDLCFSLYRHLLSLSFSPNHYTFTFLLRAAASDHGGLLGPAIHGVLTRFGCGTDRHVQSSLIHMYSSIGLVSHARVIFSDITDPDLVTITSMLTALTESGDVDSAREMFDEMSERDTVSWNAMIAGYVHLARSKDGLDLFGEMLNQGAKVNESTMVSVLTACAHLGALDQGTWVHAYIQKNRLKLNVTLGTSLIDMYSKCGSIERAMKVFWSMKEKNVFTWNSAINGLASNGAAEECLKLFELMERQGVVPDGVTFVGLLQGCCVAGLVQKGREMFSLMKDQYRIEPLHEHYGCMIDLYGRAGKLDEAVQFIHSMPIEPNVSAWRTLLHSCKMYNNVELGEYAMKEITNIEVNNDGAHVLLSNIYADNRIWKGVSSVRERMKEKGVKKEPGCSVIEVHGVVHEFFVRGKSHPRYREIKLMLGEVDRRLRLAGYQANTKEVLFDIEEEDKEDALSWHSEKLAIAFGLVVLEDGVEIRVVKNLRVCWDCHHWTKFVSKTFDRKIVVRDRNRFHHFKDGLCSCKDYW